jgi:hypothetical protein
LPKVFDKFAIEFTDFLSRHGCLEDQVASAAEIDSDGRKGFFHGQDDMSVASDTGFGTEAISKGLAEADADIFGGMVSIDVGVADGLDFQVDQGVFREEDQHVIEEADTGVDVVLTGAVEV